MAGVFGEFRGISGLFGVVRGCRFWAWMFVGVVGSCRCVVDLTRE